MPPWRRTSPLRVPSTNNGKSLLEGGGLLEGRNQSWAALVTCPSPQAPASWLACFSTDPHPAVLLAGRLSGCHPVPYGPSGNSPEVPGHQGTPAPVGERGRLKGGVGTLLPSHAAGGKADPAPHDSLCSDSLHPAPLCTILPPGSIITTNIH